MLPAALIGGGMVFYLILKGIVGLIKAIVYLPIAIIRLIFGEH